MCSPSGHGLAESDITHPGQVCVCVGSSNFRCLNHLLKQPALAINSCTPEERTLANDHHWLSQTLMLPWQPHCQLTSFALQTLMVRSCEAVYSSPSPPHLTHVTQWVWPERTINVLQRNTSQMRMVASCVCVCVRVHAGMYV